MNETTLGTSHCRYDLPLTDQSTRLIPLIEKYEALLMLVGFAGFSALVGFGYNKIRRHVFRDFHSLDVVFDAGGRVSLSLTAVSVTSQLLWPVDFLQSTTIASKVGISGSLYYTLAIILSILVFAVLCIQLKTRAPGAKTFPQIAYARFGKAAHILFCLVALLTNMVAIAILILTGKTVFNVLTKNSTSEFILLLLVVLFGSYCLIGGLGTTFYISYFNTALIFITTSFFILKFTYFAEPEVKNVTSIEALYDSMHCLLGPEGNYQESFLTFRSTTGIIYGIVTLFMTTCIVFCNQANWQSRIAAKPREGMFGFLIAVFLWFAIPTPISLVTSMVYKTMSFRNGSNLLSEDDIDSGYITPFVIQALLGEEGCFVFLTLLTMAIMSTGSGEVMSISSVLVYDIFKTHIRPFRCDAKPNDCVLCGKSLIPVEVNEETTSLCVCPPATNCRDCEKDVKRRLGGDNEHGFQYACSIHGKFRHYEDQLIRYKSWCMVVIVISIIPYGLLIIESGVNLNWTFMTSQVFIAPFIMPLYFTIGWARATSKGLIAGCISGLVCAITGMLLCGSTYENGLSDFFTNTIQDFSLLSGLISGLLVSLIVSVTVSLCMKKTAHATFPIEDQTIDPLCITELEDSSDTTCMAIEVEWLKTMAIDNPLNPYREIYKDELATINAGKTLTINHMEAIFKKTRFVSIAASVICFIIFLFVLPIVSLTHEVLSESQLSTWISVCQHWCLVATVFVVIIPPLQEGIQIWKRHKLNKDLIEEKSNELNVEMNDKMPLKSEDVTVNTY